LEEKVGLLLFTVVLRWCGWDHGWERKWNERDDRKEKREKPGRKTSFFANFEPNFIHPQAMKSIIFIEAGRV
jgi:hypothetical protein